MPEFFPLISGACLGFIIAVVPRSLRVLIGVVLSVLLGISATVFSGEFRIGWEYLLVDIPLVAMSATAAYLATGVAILRIKAWPPR